MLHRKLKIEQQENPTNNLGWTQVWSLTSDHKSNKQQVIPNVQREHISYLNLCLSVMFDIISCSFTPISFFTNSEPSWSRSNRCLSPLMLWVQIPLMARCTTLYDKVCQWLAAGRWFFQVLRFPPPIKLTTTI